MQTLPTFVYLIPAIVFFGIGMVPGLIATVIFVLPAPIRLTQLGHRLDPAVASRSRRRPFGVDPPSESSGRSNCPLPFRRSWPGSTRTIMLSLSMVVIAALGRGRWAGGAGAARSLNTVDTRLGFESGLVIVVVAILLDRILRRDRE